MKILIIITLLSLAAVNIPFFPSLVNVFACGVCVGMTIAYVISLIN